MAHALLAIQKVNVLIVDWLAPKNLSLVAVAEQVGKELAQEIQKLLAVGSNVSAFHLIGFGTGAHVGGAAGRHLQGKLGRITGLDPFGPSFSKVGASQRLDYSDAQFVDVIHTNYREKLKSVSFYVSANEPIAPLGLSKAVGHVDFYVGKGYKLPGCPRALREATDLTKSLISMRSLLLIPVNTCKANFIKTFLTPLFFCSVGKQYVLCSHQLAYHLFISSILSKCHLTAFPCRSYRYFKKAKCTRCAQFGLQTCPWIGYDISWLPSDRPLPFQKLSTFLDITKTVPYCVTYFLLKLQIGGDNSLKAYLLMKLKGKGISTAVMLVSHSSVLFKSGKMYTFLASADKDGNFTELYLEFYTRKYLYMSWRKKSLQIDRLTLTRLPHSRSLKYYAADITAVENQAVRIPLKKRADNENSL
nr:PREDICTED: lipase member H-like [Latimeria chalumnae]|eukprot:XP_014340397.1 PREDICTED: lipase member H-like [Latimeria chalumnae]